MSPIIFTTYYNLIIGECMLELIPNPGKSIDTGFAGDTYNALVYAKKCFPNIDTAYFTAVGDDQISLQMRSQWQSFGISDQFVQLDDTRSIGIYAISTDARGERSFQYWRAGSAASALFTGRSVESLFNSLSSCDWFFFSGISLGIFDDASRNDLLTLISKLRESGKTVIFDPNYRPAMFKSSEDATQWLTLCYRSADIVLPGLDEHHDLWGHTNAPEVIEFCRSLGAKEIVVKAGAEGVLAWSEETGMCHRPFVAAPKQVDTTAAGDSFAGVYIASRLSGVKISDAIDNAANVAREVVQHPGAILADSILQPIIEKHLITNS